jgi:hypothetical protein
MNLTALHQLSSWNSDTLAPLFKDLHPCPIQIDAALSGRLPCTVVVDDIQSPCAAGLRIGVCWYVVGAPSDPFLRQLRELLPRDTYSVFVLGRSIQPRQREILFKDSYFVCAESRYAQRVNPEPIECALPVGYETRPIDACLLAGDLHGIAELRESILSLWPSMDVFCRDGFGFAAIHGSAIVSRSFTDCVIGDACEIGVETLSEHRLHGLGAYVASRTANDAFARGLRRVGWMSWANNAGSIVVSQRAGFVETCQYDVYINHWPAENPEDLSPGEFRAFAEEYERRFSKQSPSGSGYPHIVAATAWALAGDSARCREQLHRAIDMGWLRTVDQLRSLWPELFEDPEILTREAWLPVWARLSMKQFPS